MTDLADAELRTAVIRALCTDHGHVSQEGGLSCRTCRRRADAILDGPVAELRAELSEARRRIDDLLAEVENGGRSRRRLRSWRPGRSSGTYARRGSPVNEQPLFGGRLEGRYDDARSITIEGCVNYEVAVRIGNQEPLFLDGLDLLRLVSYVVLDLLYGPSPTAGEGH